MLNQLTTTNKVLNLTAYIMIIGGALNDGFSFWICAVPYFCYLFWDSAINYKNRSIAIGHSSVAILFFLLVFLVDFSTSSFIYPTVGEEIEIKKDTQLRIGTYNKYFLSTYIKPKKEKPHEIVTIRKGTKVIISAQYPKSEGLTNSYDFRIEISDSNLKKEILAAGAQKHRKDYWRFGVPDRYKSGHFFISSEDLNSKVVENNFGYRRGYRRSLILDILTFPLVFFIYFPASFLFVFFFIINLVDSRKNNIKEPIS